MRRPSLLALLSISLALPAAAQDGLAARNRAFLREVRDAALQLDSVAAFFPRHGEWTWTQTLEGAPPGQRVRVRRFAATETLRTISRGGPACASFWAPGGEMGPPEGTLVARIHGTRWRRVTGNRFVPSGESARSPVFVQWRREDGRWVVSGFGDAINWSPPVLGEIRGGDVVRDTVLPLPPTPVYPAGASWYVNHEPISFEGYRYVKRGLPRPLADSLLARIGRFGLVGVYAETGATAEPEVFYIPVAPGEYQAYEANPGRGRRCG